MIGVGLRVGVGIGVAVGTRTTTGVAIGVPVCTLGNTWVGVGRSETTRPQLVSRRNTSPAPLRIHPLPRTIIGIGTLPTSGIETVGIIPQARKRRGAPSLGLRF
jgi:hypothetical protein